jgi:tripartite-type tricarboxylate transporter receptor subunit TctC
MKTRVKLLGFGVMAWASLAAGAVGAQDYPTKPVTIIVPQAPGGTNDIIARLLAADLTTRLGQQFIVENKAGAGGNIGTQYAARSTPDGYAILLTISSTQAINPAVYKKVPFDPVKDFEPIGIVATVPNVLVAHPSFPANTMKEAIALAKTKPGYFRYASAGNGSLNHLLGAMLNSMAGISLEHVPYKGVGPALTDVVGNQVPLAFASLPSVLPFIKSGKLKALGVSSLKRAPSAPDIPAISETIPNYSGDLWVGLFGVKGTPKPIMAKLTSTLDKIAADKATQEKFSSRGAEMYHTTPEELAAILKTDIDKWARIVKDAGATID